MRRLLTSSEISSCRPKSSKAGLTSKSMTNSDHFLRLTLVDSMQYSCIQMKLFAFVGQISQFFLLNCREKKLLVRFRVRREGRDGRFTFTGRGLCLLECFTTDMRKRVGNCEWRNLASEESFQILLKVLELVCPMFHEVRFQDDKSMRSLSPLWSKNGSQLPMSKQEYWKVNNARSPFHASSLQLRPR